MLEIHYVFIEKGRCFLSLLLHFKFHTGWDPGGQTNIMTIPPFTPFLDSSFSSFQFAIAARFKMHIRHKKKILPFVALKNKILAIIAVNAFI